MIALRNCLQAGRIPIYFNPSVNLLKVTSRPVESYEEPLEHVAAYLRRITNKGDHYYNCAKIITVFDLIKAVKQAPILFSSDLSSHFITGLEGYLELLGIGISEEPVFNQGKRLRNKRKRQKRAANKAAELRKNNPKPKIRPLKRNRLMLKQAKL